MPNSSVVALDIGVLLRLAGLDIVKCDPLLLCPFDQLLTDVFGAVIDPDCQWLAPPFDNLVEAAHDSLCRQ